MAKKICELCEINQSSDMLFGVALCDECRKIHSGISQGNAEVINKVLSSNFFINSTAKAKTHCFENLILKYIEQLEREINI